MPTSDVVAESCGAVVGPRDIHAAVATDAEVDSGALLVHVDEMLLPVHVRHRHCGAIAK